MSRLPQDVDKNLEYKVLDPYIVLHGGKKAVYAFKPTNPNKTNYVVLTPDLWTELMKHQDDVGEFGRNVREFSEEVKLLREQRRTSLEEGIKIDENYHLVSIREYNPGLDREVDPRVGSTPQTRTFKTALTLHRKGKKVELITNNPTLANLANSYGVPVSEWKDLKSVQDPSQIYRGRRDLLMPEDFIDAFYAGGRITLEELACDPELEAIMRDNPFVRNEYFFIQGRTKRDVSALGRCVRTNDGQDVLQKLNPLTEDKIGRIECVDYEQRFAMDALLDPAIPLVILTGSAGTGKTLLAMTAAYFGWKHEWFKKALISKPIVDSGRKGIGFLPGSKEEKILPWVAPVFDNLGLISSEKDVELFKRIIEVEASAFLRGRNFPNLFFLLDEGQNCTRGEMKTVVTRMAKGSKLVVTGDTSQIDDPYLDETTNGLSHLIQATRGQELVATVHLKNCKRSPLADMGAKLL